MGQWQAEHRQGAIGLDFNQPLRQRPNPGGCKPLVQNQNPGQAILVLPEIRDDGRCAVFNLGKTQAGGIKGGQ